VARVWPRKAGRQLVRRSMMLHANRGPKGRTHRILLIKARRGFKPARFDRYEWTLGMEFRLSRRSVLRTTASAVKRGSTATALMRSAHAAQRAVRRRRPSRFKTGPAGPPVGRGSSGDWVTRQIKLHAERVALCVIGDVAGTTGGAGRGPIWAGFETQPSRNPRVLELPPLHPQASSLQQLDRASCRTIGRASRTFRELFE